MCLLDPCKRNRLKPTCLPCENMILMACGVLPWESMKLCLEHVPVCVKMCWLTKPVTSPLISFILFIALLYPLPLFFLYICILSVLHTVSDASFFEVETIPTFDNTGDDPLSSHKRAVVSIILLRYGRKIMITKLWDIWFDQKKTLDYTSIYTDVFLWAEKAENIKFQIRKNYWTATILLWQSPDLFYMLASLFSY